jgi:hypothetical protein
MSLLFLVKYLLFLWNPIAHRARSRFKRFFGSFFAGTKKNIIKKKSISSSLPCYFFHIKKVTQKEQKRKLLDQAGALFIFHDSQFSCSLHCALALMCRQKTNQKTS